MLNSFPGVVGVEILHHFWAEIRLRTLPLVCVHYFASWSLRSLNEAPHSANSFYDSWDVFTRSFCFFSYIVQIADEYCHLNGLRHFTSVRDVYSGHHSLPIEAFISSPAFNFKRCNRSLENSTKCSFFLQSRRAGRVKRWLIPPWISMNLEELHDGQLFVNCVWQVSDLWNSLFWLQGKEFSFSVHNIPRDKASLQHAMLECNEELRTILRGVEPVVQEVQLTLPVLMLSFFPSHLETCVLCFACFCEEPISDFEFWRQAICHVQRLKQSYDLSTFVLELKDILVRL